MTILSCSLGSTQWESALAAQARLQSSNFSSNLWDKDMQNHILGGILRKFEAEGLSPSLHDGDDNELDWKNDPAFRRPN
jgi:hypothetical protein